MKENSKDKRYIFIMKIMEFPTDNWVQTISKTMT